MVGRPASVDELEQVPVFSSLDDGALVRLAARMERRELAPGEAVLREGEEGDRFYVVLSGLLGVWEPGVGQAAVLTPGEYVGELALVEHVPRTATVSALGEAVVASCDEPTFGELVAPLFWA